MMNATKTVTLPVDSAYRPCFPSFQFEGRTAEFTAHLREFAVESETGTRFHGMWENEEEAQRFAYGVWGTAKAIKVEPYWYVRPFGRLQEKDFPGFAL